MTVLAVACLALAATLLVPAVPELPRRPRVVPATAAPGGWMVRWRPLCALLGGAAAATFLSMPYAAVAAPVAAAAVWVVIGRAEPPEQRRVRESARRELPHVVGLMADALRAGQSPEEAVALVCRALPGPAADRLAEVVPRLRLGMDPAAVWSALVADEALGPLARTLSRATTSGAPVVPAVERLAVALAEDARGEVEDRARAVGVRAAVPLGLCLLPCFVLLGIVPVVAGMLGTLGL